jgi:hypothetical protein
LAPREVLEKIAEELSPRDQAAVTDAYGRCEPLVRNMRQGARTFIMSCFHIGVEVRRLEKNGGKYKQRLVEVLGEMVRLSASRLYEYKAVADAYTQRELERLIERCEADPDMKPLSMSELTTAAREPDKKKRLAKLKERPPRRRPRMQKHRARTGASVETRSKANGARASRPLFARAVGVMELDRALDAEVEAEFSGATQPVETAVPRVSSPTVIDTDFAVRAIPRVGAEMRAALELARHHGAVIDAVPAESWSELVRLYDIARELADATAANADKLSPMSRSSVKSPVDRGSASAPEDAPAKAAEDSAATAAVH